ncbi:hypothetical protein BAE44_0010773, partial [Dichanthelium oligosanthes]
LDESSSQDHNTQVQGRSAHMLETVEEETTSSSPTDYLGETLVALGIIEIPDELQHQQDSIMKEERTLLLVIFSYGYPLTEDELNDFFGWYGVVEKIAIDEPSLSPNPLCALFTYRSP